MSNKLHNAIEEYLNKVKTFDPKLIGVKWHIDEIKKVEDELNIKLPSWYVELLTNFPLKNIEVGHQFYKPEDDDDGVIGVIFVGVEVQECLDAVPGCEIFDRGYICIGYDTIGSGDPFFICLNEGFNPPVYQVYHDVGDEADEILNEGKIKIADSLSEFFMNSIIR